jgi:hypothetical protein
MEHFVDRLARDRLKRQPNVLPSDANRARNLDAGPVERLLYRIRKLLPILPREFERPAWLRILIGARTRNE